MPALRYRLTCPHCAVVVESNDAEASAGHPCRGRRNLWLPLVLAVPKRKKVAG